MVKYFYDYGICDNGDIIGKRGNILKQREKEGRKEVKLSIEGKQKTFISARLIYCVFNNIDIETLDKDVCISFKDGDKLNVSLDNLYCVSRANLIQGQKHKSIAKLTDKQVEEIKQKYYSTLNNKPINQHDKKGGYNSYRKLAKEYNVTYPQIRHIIKGEARNEDKYKIKEGV